MAVIPTYKRQVQFQPQPITSSADVFTALSASATAVTKGAEESITKEKKTALEANKFMTATDVMKESSAIFDRAQTQTDKQKALAQYKTSYQTYSDTVLKTVPKDNQLYTKRLLFSLGNQGAKKFQQQITEQGKLEALDKSNETIHVLLSQATNAGATPTPTGQKDATVFGGQLVSNVTKTVDSGLRSAGWGATTLQGARKEIEESRVVAHAQVAMTEKDPEQKIAALKKKILTDKSYNSIYTPGERDGLVKKIDAEVNSAKTKLGVSAQQAVNIDNDLVTQVAQNGKDNLQQLALRNEISPGTSDEFQQKYQIAKLNGQTVAALKYAPIDKMMLAIEEAKKELTPDQLNQPGSTAKIAAKTQLAKNLTDNLNAFIEHPASYTETNPDFIAQDSQLKANTITFSPSDPRYVGQVQKYQEARQELMLSYQRQLGLSEKQLSLLDGEQAKIASMHINSLQADQVLPVIGDLENTFGKNTNMVMRNLVQKHGANPVSNWFRGLASNPKSAPFANSIIQGFQLGRAAGLEGLKLQGVSSTQLANSVSAALQPYNATVTSTNGPTLQYMLDTQQAVEQATMGLMLVKHEPLAQAAQDASDAMVNNHYQLISPTPGILATFGKKNLTPFLANMITSGRRIRIPAKSDPVAYEKAINSLQTVTILNPPKDLIIPGWVKKNFPSFTDEEARQYYNTVGVANGGVVNTPEDNGAHLTDQAGIPIQTASKGEIAVHWPEMDDPSSPAYQRIAEMEKLAKKEPLISTRRDIKEFREGRAVFSYPFETSQSDIFSDTFKNLVSKIRKL